MFNTIARLEYLARLRDAPADQAEEREEHEEYEDGSDGTSYGDYVARRRAWQDYLRRQEEELRRIEEEYEQDSD